MIKCIALVSRLPHLDRDAFKDYYETRHAPMIPSLFPMMATYARDYPKVRNFRPPEGQSVDDVINFDAITIMTFNSREDFDAYKQVFKDEAVMRRIQEDEAKFLDGSKTRLFVVDECVSDLPG